MLTKEGPTAFYKGWAPPPERKHGFHLVKAADDDLSTIHPLFSASIAQICAVVSKTGLVERRDVRLVRANQEGHDGHQEEDWGQKLRLSFGVFWTKDLNQWTKNHRETTHAKLVKAFPLVCF